MKRTFEGVVHESCLKDVYSIIGPDSTEWPHNWLIAALRQHTNQKICLMIEIEPVSLLKEINKAEMSKNVNVKAFFGAIGVYGIIALIVAPLVEWSVKGLGWAIGMSGLIALIIAVWVANLEAT